MVQQQMCATYDVYLNASSLVTVHKVNVIWVELLPSICPFQNY